MISKCPLCSGGAHVEYSIQSFFCNCRACGRFTMTDFAADRLNRENCQRDKPKVTAYIKQREINKLPIVKIFVDKEKAENQDYVVTLDEMINSFPSTFSERIDNVLINLSKLSAFMGDYFEINENSIPVFIVDSYDLKSVLFMLKFMYDENYIEKNGGENVPVLPSQIRLTPKGWEKVLLLEKGTDIFSKQVFVAMWFHDSVEKAYTMAYTKLFLITGIGL